MDPSAASSTSSANNHSPPAQTSALAIASLVCGILSCLGFFLLTGIPAIITGHLAKSKIKKSSVFLNGKGMATAGLIMGYISTFALVAIIAVFAAIATPLALKQARQVDLFEATGNAKQTYLLLLEYENRHGQFPEFLDELDNAGLGTLDAEGNREWNYFPNLSRSSPSHYIVLATTKPADGKIVALYIDGKVQLINEADYQAAVLAQQNPNY
ncbi:MAG: DUF4190 domain-containing protein [Akkermansiaceae bacterium]